MQLQATGITAGYGEGDILHGVDVQVNSGEFVGLVGPNGCGKSTLLRAISRTLRLKSGSVIVDGTSISDVSALELARLMAFVPQQEPAGFDFTVRDVVMMGRYPHRIKHRGETQHDYDMVNSALADADIAQLEGRPITRLSGGEHRRVLLARALAQDTPLILLDEPTAHLDVTHQAELLLLVQRLVRDRGRGALAALHELNHAAEYCDRLILLSHGEVVDQGSPADVLNPDNLRIAYGARARVGRNPISGRPMILSLTSLRGEPDTPSASAVHLICGGGSGIHIFHALLRRGYSVTTGVLNENDNDWETALALGIETAVEAPFSTISARAGREARALLHRADAVLIADVPFGVGNLANLEMAAEALSAGKSVVMLDDGDVDRRDYTGGTAARLIGEMLQNGAMRYLDIEEWLAVDQPRRR